MIQDCQKCFYYDKDYATKSIFIQCDKTGINCYSFRHNYKNGDICHISGFGLDESLVKVASCNGGALAYSRRIAITKTNIVLDDFRIKLTCPNIVLYGQSQLPTPLLKNLVII